MKKVQQFLKKRIWVIVAALVLLTSGGFAWFYLSDRTDEAGQTDTQLEITQVRRGDMSAVLTGTGTLLAGSETDLSFAVSGTVAKLNVQVGDKVETGDELAVLDGQSELEVNIQTKALNLKTAQETLNDLLAGADRALAEAQVTLAEAQEACDDALKNLRQSGVGRCDDQTIQDYYFEYIYAQNAVNEWEAYLADGSGYGEDYILSKLAKLRKERDKVYVNWQYCQGYTKEEISESEAALDLAEAEMTKAEADYEKLKEVSGLDPDALALAEAEVKQAELELAVAKKQLAGSIISAPSDGTVLSIATAVGEEAASNSTAITVADLTHPKIEIYIDETDIAQFEVGSTAEITFDAIPDRVFTGVVEEIQPMLVTLGAYNAAQGLVDLDDGTIPSSQTLPLGLTASVDITSIQAKNALLVSAEALHELDDGEYGVYVFDEDGKTYLQKVEIGAMDYTNAEILSGLEAGQKIILSGMDVN